MNVPLSWLKDYVDIDLPLPELARLLTMAGLEVEAVTLVGLPMPEMEKITNASSAACRGTPKRSSSPRSMR